MFHKCYKCNLISLVYKDNTKSTKTFFPQLIFCPYCGSDNTNSLPLWVIQQEVKNYLKKKKEGKEIPQSSEMLGDIEYLIKLLEIAEIAETLKKIGE